MYKVVTPAINNIPAKLNECKVVLTLLEWLMYMYVYIILHVGAVLITVTAWLVRCFVVLHMSILRVR